MAEQTQPYSPLQALISAIVQYNLLLKTTSHRDHKKHSRTNKHTG